MTLKEEIVDKANSVCCENINEEAVITESIKNGSVSKALDKQISKLENSRGKADDEGKREIDNDITLYRKASTSFRKAEEAYADGDPSAKKQYKELKKQYSSQIRKINVSAIAKGGAVAAAVAAGVAGACVLFGRFDPTDAEKIKDAISSGTKNVFKTISRKAEDIFDPAKTPTEKISRAVKRTGEDLGVAKPFEDADNTKKLLSKGAESAKKAAEKAKEDFGKGGMPSDFVKTHNGSYAPKGKTFGANVDAVEKKVSNLFKGKKSIKENILDMDNVLNG